VVVTQAKGLINGLAAASLMFTPGAMVPPSYAEDIKTPSFFLAEDTADEPAAEAPKPKVFPLEYVFLLH
jgi:hypothetical protein